MCGICGELNFINKNVAYSNIKRMADSILHRGPDDEGIYCNGAIGLGHRRLSIIDLSPCGRQPMWSNDKSLCIVFNGEIYNFQEIKKELLANGYNFASTTDTEVVVNAIHNWGIEKALSKFIGMFAFAVWDGNRKIITLCRDRAGIKPLYYYVDEKVFLFGSELKALLANPNFKKELNHSALGQHFVNGYFLDNHTVFKNVFRITPGHYLTVNSNGFLQQHKYWGLDSIERGSFKGSFEDAVIELEPLLESAFSYRLVSDVPVGLFLSGGIDSSLVSTFLKKKINADILNITIGFGEEKYDESPKAKKLSDELGVRHIVHYIDTKEAQETLLNFCEIYDEPFGDTSGIPTYILSKLARQHVKVALSADGGDEQFCGYENYSSYLKNYSFVTKFPWIIRFILSTLLEQAIPYRQLISWRLKSGRGVVYHPQSMARYEKMLRLLKISDETDIIRLMNEKAWSQETISELLSVNKNDIFKDTVLSDGYLSTYREELMDTMMRTDYLSFLRDDILVKVDRASMFVSLECRDPFLDHRIAEFAYSLPINYLYDHGEHKRILREILRKWISEAIISSPKRGFMIPLYYWLKGVWKPVVMEYLSKERVRSVGILNEKTVEHEVAKFYNYNGCRAEKIWMMLNFQMWAERWYKN